MATYEDVILNVHAHVPLADMLLCRAWVEDVYADLADRYPWHFLYKHTSVSVAASRDIAVGVTQGDATVTSVALFVAGDVNRQFRIGSGPTYTILTFTDASNVELDQVYAGTTNAAATATILDCFLRMPADFGSQSHL